MPLERKWSLWFAFETQTTAVYIHTCAHIKQLCSSHVHSPSEEEVVFSHLIQHTQSSSLIQSLRPQRHNSHAHTASNIHIFTRQSVFFFSDTHIHYFFSRSHTYMHTHAQSHGDPSPWHWHSVCLISSAGGKKTRRPWPSLTKNISHASSAETYLVFYVSTIQFLTACVMTRPVLLLSLSLCDKAVHNQKSPHKLSGGFRRCFYLELGRPMTCNTTWNNSTFISPLKVRDLLVGQYLFWDEVVYEVLIK